MTANERTVQRARSAFQMAAAVGVSDAMSQRMIQGAYAMIRTTFGADAWRIWCEEVTR